MANVDIQANVDDVERWERELVDSWDFTMPGEEESLGRDMARDVAMGIQERTVADQHDVHGSPLLPNEEKYAAYKARKYGARQPLIRTGQMLSLASLVGDVQVTHDEIVMTYGTGETPERSGSPTGYMSAADERVTDREKAEYNSDRRPFYALDERINESIMARVTDSWEKHIRERA